MPVGPVDDNDTVLYYEDGGPPEGSLDYVTLILVHGTQFHSAVFRKIFPFAHSRNLRLVLVNCRDYPGSTRYSSKELEGFSSSQKAVQAETLRARGIEFAAFIRWFIEIHHVPPISEQPGSNSPSGGISLLGWSSGNLQTIPLLAYATDLPEDTTNLLERYFRHFTIYDISDTAAGLEGLYYTPVRDHSLSAEQRAVIFPIWVSSYFKQTATTPDADVETPGFQETLLAREALHESDPNPRWVPTVVRMGPEGVSAVTDASVMQRSQVQIQQVDPSVYENNLRRALFECRANDGHKGKRVVWPKLRINIVWCDMSPSSCVYATHHIKRMAKVYKEQGMGRAVQFHRMQQANHFVHWDEPERFIDFLSQIL